MIAAVLGVAVAPCGDKLLYSPLVRREALFVAHQHSTTGQRDALPWWTYLAMLGQHLYGEERDRESETEAAYALRVWASPRSSPARPRHRGEPKA